MNKPKLIAHRGDTTHFQENTLEAFVSAFEHKAAGIELDIHLYNNKIIVVHDYLFNKNDEYPILNDILQKTSKNGTIIIEIKSMDQEMMELLSSVLSQYPNADIELSTSVYPLFPHIKKQFPKHKIGIIFQPNLFEEWMNKNFVIEMVCSWTKLSQASIAHVPYRYISSELVTYLHKNSILVHSHIKKSANQVIEYEYLSKLGVDQCTFDDILLTKQIIDG